MMKELGSIEPFFESVPSVLIMTCIWLHGLGGDGYSTAQLFNQYSLCARSRENFCAVFDGLGGPSWFFTTYGVSVFSSSLGMLKFLQHGPVAILPTNLMNCRVVIAFLGIIFSLVAKGLYAGILIAAQIGEVQFGHVLWQHCLLFISINVVPNVILAILGVSLVTGLNKMALKTFMEYPAILVLPTFTNFVVGPPVLSCCGKFNTSSKNCHLVVSKRLSAINTGMTAICYLSVVVYLGIFDVWWFSIFGIIFSPVLVFSVSLTAIFLSFDRINAFCCSPKCLATQCEYIDIENITIQDGLQSEIRVSK